MKKTVCVLLILILCIGAAFALVACNKDSVKIGDTLDFGAIYSTSTYTNKYYDYDDNIFYTVTEKETYKFCKNGSGIYTYYSIKDYDNYERKDRITHYLINFNYEYIDSDKSSVAVFYDGITYADDHNQKTDGDLSTWRDIISVSKSVLINLSYTAKYYNVDYLKKAYPNFNLNKPEEK